MGKNSRAARLIAPPRRERREIRRRGRYGRLGFGFPRGPAGRAPSPAPETLALP